MRFYTNQHPLYCGIDLHARSMYLCILTRTARSCCTAHASQSRSRSSRPLRPTATDWSSPSSASSPGTGSPTSVPEGIPSSSGHALYMKAIHGGKAKNDTIDAQKIAGLLRGGILPQAYVYPAAKMRATRDLLRRRYLLMRQRAELLAHVQHTNSQYNLPEIGKKLAYKAEPCGVAERFPILPSRTGLNRPGPD